MTHRHELPNGSLHNRHPRKSSETGSVTQCPFVAVSATNALLPLPDAAELKEKDLTTTQPSWCATICTVDRLFHIARLEDWEEARREGVYRASTIDRRLEDEGFIHLSLAHQVKLVADAVYSGRNDLALLTIDPAKLKCSVVVEDLDGSGNRFPHAYGELNLDAVEAARPFEPTDDGTFPAITDSAA